MSSQASFNLIVVGAGHAGIEAAFAASKMGLKVALITLSRRRIGWMPCNPAVGGVGKGHLVFEVSALDGLMPKLCTKTYLQVRMLNTKKGPAVQGLRLQIDKHAYQSLAQQAVEQLPNLTVIEDEVIDLLEDQGAISGVKCLNHKNIYAPCVVITTGTFLQGLTHIGTEQKNEGRSGEPASDHLSQALKRLGLSLGRLKTGTPPRLLRNSLDFKKMEKQNADELNYLFEFYPHKTFSSHTCHITKTNTRTHEVIRSNLDKSAMFSGQIRSRGPRYCPSIEDKIFRFAFKESHQIFVEPEGAGSDEIYPNGLSTSLPLDVQEQYIRSIEGFENAIIVRPGYAVEYDFVFPDQLSHTLETKKIAGLFCAGQINGTTGYEEAAAQGIIAGINAALKVLQKPPFILHRYESYIGVMIDDLVTMSVDEPYRMFTSRAERRLILRQDNAFLRLMPKAYHLGIVDKVIYDDFCAEKLLFEETCTSLRSKFPRALLARLIGTPECPFDAIGELAGIELPERVCRNIHAEFLYEPYIARELQEVERAKQYQSLKISQDIDYSKIDGLSIELRQKLAKFKPVTIAQAMLIPGMTPAAISLLIFKSRNRKAQV